MLLFGAKDDRVIRTDPVDMIGQYNFITSEAIMARITKTGNPEYSKNACLQLEMFRMVCGNREDEDTVSSEVHYRHQLKCIKQQGRKLQENFQSDKHQS